MDVPSRNLNLKNDKLAGGLRQAQPQLRQAQPQLRQAQPKIMHVPVQTRTL